MLNRLVYLPVAVLLLSAGLAVAAENTKPNSEAEAAVEEALRAASAPRPAGGELEALQKQRELASQIAAKYGDPAIPALLKGIAPYRGVWPRSWGTSDVDNPFILNCIFAINRAGASHEVQSMLEASRVPDVHRRITTVVALAAIAELGGEDRRQHLAQYTLDRAGTAPPSLIGPSGGADSCRLSMGAANVLQCFPDGPWVDDLVDQLKKKGPGGARLANGLEASFRYRRALKTDAERDAYGRFLRRFWFTHAVSSRWNIARKSISNVRWTADALWEGLRPEEVPFLNHLADEATPVLADEHWIALGLLDRLWGSAQQALKEGGAAAQNGRKWQKVLEPHATWQQKRAQVVAQEEENYKKELMESGSDVSDWPAPEIDLLPPYEPPATRK